MLPSVLLMMVFATAMVPMILCKFFTRGFWAVCPTSPRCASRSKILPWLCVIFSVLRIGEASHPGPAESFILGIANPSGLRHKAPFVSTHMSHGDIWAFSETHLSAKDVAAFEAGLHFAGEPFRKLIGGYPVSVTAQGAGGNWKGVGVLSKHPTRRLPHDWSPEISQSSRITATTTLVRDVWISGCTVYAEPDSHLYPSRLRHTEALLQAAISRIGMLSVGPRFIAGDWNADKYEVPAFATLEQIGFRDLQDIALERWANPVQPTCKGATRRDYCYISPELQEILIDVQVIQDLWPDHAVVQGHFGGFSTCIPRDVWPVPQPFPWPSQWSVDCQFWKNAQGSPSEKYRKTWAHFEDMAAGVLPFKPPKKCFGRAATSAPRQVKVGQFAPVRRARNGDFQPHFVGASFRHAQWIRQVRRLQVYARTVSASQVSPHACQLWGAIFRAAGFAPSFQGWWQELQKKCFGAPAQLPMMPPLATTAKAIFETVAMAVRDLEAELMKSSRQYAKIRRMQNPNQIFQDLKKPASPGIDLFVKPLRSKIVSIDEDSLAIELDKAQEWVLDKPVFCGDQVLSVIHAEADCIWLNSLEHVCVGTFVSQTKCSGTKEELAEAFLAAWSIKWERHRDVPHDRWSQILQFARSHMPRQTLDWPSLDVASLARCIEGKKTTTSGGLDGVSIHDLRCLPVTALQNFCDMFADAEHDGSWPSQLLEGRVACVAKCPEPSDVMDFRPISILGLLYRVWGTHHARRAVRALDPILPPTLFGSRPAHYAGQVWSQVLWVIEDSYANDIPLAGLIADLQKAFNFLPRLVVFETAAWIGVPLRVLTAWAGAVAGLKRRFQIRDGLSDPAPSSTGFAEGDALSCVAMVIVDVLFHAWYACYFPLCQPVSYVDDWQVLSVHHDAMSAIFRCMTDFTDAMDLMIDPRKTFAWATTTQGRAALKQQGFDTVGSCKSLGAHVQFTRQHTNASQVERIQSLHDLWPRLRLSASPYKQKVRAIKQAAWARGLHAIAGTTIGSNHFQALRAGAIKGINADSAGCNAHLHLLISDCLLDPQAWTIWHTFRFVRECGNNQVVMQALSDLCTGASKLSSNGISSTLLCRIQMLGWHVAPGGLLQDEFGGFSLFEVSPEELLWRLEWAWIKVVGAAVAHRPGLVDFSCVDVQATRAWISKLSVQDQALMRKVLDGSHITQDSKKYCQDGSDDQCPFCPCSDSRYHRFWQCEYHQSCRQHVSREVWELVPDLPECVTAYGWALQPSTCSEWFHHLACIDETPVCQSHFMHVFTDGSCFNPHVAAARFAAWAIVTAPCDSGSDSDILECGPLPGLRQTSMRAEIYAVHRAVRYAVRHGTGLMIWCDCAAVVRKFNRLLHGGILKRNSPNCDLWELIVHDLAELQVMIGITKVAAHKDIDSATTALEEWCYRHNLFADIAAGRANLLRPVKFWDLLTRHVHACCTVHRWNTEIQQVLLAISNAVMKSDIPNDEGVVLASAEVPEWEPLPQLVIPAQATRWYGDDQVRSILSWFWSVLADSQEDVRWTSHFHLFIDYTASSGEVGPVHFGRWQNGTKIPLQGLRNAGFKERTRWFTKVLKECLRHLGICLSYCYCCPDSTMLAMHTGCIALPWPKWRLLLADNYLYKFSPGAFRRQTKALDSVPVAPRIPEFPFAVVSTC